MELPEQDRQALIEAARRRGQGGAAFGVYPSSGKRPERLNVSRDVNMPAQVARGWVAGTLGLPGDIEGLGRMLINMAPAGQEHERVTGRSFVSETPVLPTSDFYKEWLPGGDDRPAAQFASGLGALAGGAGATRVAGAAVKGAKATGKALGPKAAEMAEGYLQRSGLAPTVVKPKGGNWLSGSVEGATEPLVPKPGARGRPASETMREMEAVYPPDVLQSLSPETSESVNRAFAALKPDVAVEDWINTKLNKYIRNEMGTPEDPVRKLAERDVLHVAPEQLNFRPEMHGRYLAEGQTAVAQSPTAKTWEGAADLMIQPTKVGELLSKDSWLPDLPQYRNPLENNPWLEKVSPDTSVYALSTEAGRPTVGSDLGFDHLIDELRNATRADSDLPANLRWKPEDLKKVTMEQAVERVAKINEYRAAKKAEANEVLARNPATAPYKDYETVPGTQEPNQKGLAWKQIKQQELTAENLSARYEIREMPNKSGGKYFSIRDKEDRGLEIGAGQTPEAAIKNAGKRIEDTSLRDALEYEGEVMGHCVGGYCDDVLEGRSQIYSLRDKKGEPHVTIEVKPPKTYTEDDVIEQFPGGVTDAMRQGDVGAKKYIAAKLAEMNDLNRPQEIIQIKGKGNAAPKAEYLPFVQDFVRSGNWSKVGDLKNTGLIKLGDQYLPKEEVGPLIERASRFIEETPALREHREAQRAYENYSGPVPSAEYTALQRAAGRQVHPTIPYTYRELRAILDDPDAFADRNTDALAPNLERIERLRQLVGEQGYAKGGLVEDTDAIVAKLTGMDKDKALTHALRMANAKQEAHMAAGGLAKVLKGAKKAEEATKAAKATEKAAEAAKPAAKVVSESEALQKSKQAGYPMAPKDRWYGEGTYDKSGGRLEMLSPDEFLRKVRPLKIDDASRDNIDDLKRHIQSGGELDPLLITKSGKEDGRHRAHAAKELGITKVPVIRYDKEVPAAPRAEALETARKNAVKMLGLPENNTAMDRARALGFDTEAYKGMHPYDPNTGEIWGVRNGRFVPVENIGAEPEVIRSIDPTRTSKMELGGRHAGFFGGKDIANAFAGYTSKNSAVFPVLLNMGKNPEIFEGAGKYAGAFQFERPAGMNNNLDEYKRFQRAFFSDSPSSGAVIKDTVDEGTIFIPRAGNQVRSRFAAFDPARVNENDLLGAADPALLAGTAVASGIGLGALGQMSKPKPKQEEKKKAAGGLAKRM